MALCLHKLVAAVAAVHAAAAPKCIVKISNPAMTGTDFDFARNTFI